MNPIKFPAKIIEPIKNFLSKEERRLQKRKRELDKQDPFEDERRADDNAAADTDAAEQFGHEKTEALKKEVDRKLIQIRKSLTRIKIGKYGICEKCNRLIDTDRLMIMPETTICVKCEREKGG